MSGRTLFLQSETPSPGPASPLFPAGRTWLTRLWQSIAERGLTFASIPPASIDPVERARMLAHSLLSESGEAFLVLSNDENEIWFISNRHLRTYDLRPDSAAFRLPLRATGGRLERNGHKAGALEEAAVR